MNKKQILLVSSYSQGGIASVVDTFLNNGLEETVAYFASYTEAPTWLNWIRFPFIYIKFLSILLFDQNIKIVHLLSAEKGSFLRKSVLLFTAKLLGKKVIINFHSCSQDLFYNDSFFLFKIFVKTVLNNADIILVLSTQWKKIISQKCENKNIEVLYNPVKLREYYEKNDSAGQINVLFRGRVGKRKGAYDTIEAAKLLTNNSIIINIYGDGEIENAKNLVTANNLNNRVKIKGWITGEKIDIAYRSSDIFILPSYDEGLPMSILEAMSYGLPVIATNIAGIPDQIAEGVNGYMIEPGDIKSLAEKIDFLANTLELRNSMGREGYEMVKSKFEKTVIIDNLKRIYDSLF